MEKALEELEKLKKGHLVSGRLPLLDRVRFELIEKDLRKGYDAERVLKILIDKEIDIALINDIIDTGDPKTDWNFLGEYNEACADHSKLTISEWTDIIPFIRKMRPLEHVSAASEESFVGDVNPLSKGLYDDIRCPFCGAKHFTINYTTSTLVHSPVVVTDGQAEIIGGNKTTTHCTCLNCMKEFTF